MFKKTFNAMVILFVLSLYVFWGQLFAHESNFDNRISQTLYVEKYGKDNNTGSKEKPLQTIQKALSLVRAGDSIYVGKGHYNESIKIIKSGSEKKPILLKGMRSSEGEFLTIIDPSIQLTDWEKAPDIGKGVYKKLTSFNPHEITVNGKRICGLNKTIMGSGKGFDILSRDDSYQSKLRRTKQFIKFWDGIEVIYGYKDGTTYIRFRNEENPNNFKIMASPEGQAILIKNKSHNIIKDFLIQGANKCISLIGTKCCENNIENNYLKNGKYRIFMRESGKHNKIVHNVLTMDYYVPEFLGAGNLQKGYELQIKRHVYHVFKFMFGHGTSNDAAIRMRNIKGQTIISGNEIFGGLVGITASSINECPSSNIIVKNNKIYKMSSTGITSSENVHNFRIFNNIIYDCNINIRLHRLNFYKRMDRSVYIYNNFFWNPQYAGFHFYAFTKEKYGSNPCSKYYIFNNFFSGGRMFFAAKDQILKTQGLKKTYFINNIINAGGLFNKNIYNIIKTKMGAFEYNILGNEMKISTNASTLLFGSNILKDLSLLGNPFSFEQFSTMTTKKVLKCTESHNLLSEYKTEHSHYVPDLTLSQICSTYKNSCIGALHSELSSNR